MLSYLHSLPLPPPLPLLQPAPPLPPIQPPQTYDLAFLCEINFPVLLMELVKSTVAERHKSVQKVTEAEELEEYKQNMSMWEQCKTSSSFKNWFEEKVTTFNINFPETGTTRNYVYLALAYHLYFIVAIL